MCLISFVASLGTVFEWATRDLSFKLLILKEHQRLDPINYETIQSMILYEIKSGRVQTKDTSLFIEPGKPLPNGCRTLLRLHRALAFISAFLSEMRTAPNDASSATIAWNAYSATLGRFHSWPVKHTYENEFFFKTFQLNYRGCSNFIVRKNFGRAEIHATPIRMKELKRYFLLKFCFSMKVIIFFLFRIRVAIKLTLPTREDLIDKLLSKRSADDIDLYTDEIVRSCNIIERTTQELFETHNLTKLS